MQRTGLHECHELREKSTFPVDTRTKMNKY